MKVFQAYGTGGAVTAETALAAAELFFSTFPTARKCDIVQGNKEGPLFVPLPPGETQKRFYGVTKRTLETVFSEGIKQCQPS
jgi:hypothetical protein